MTPDKVLSTASDNLLFCQAESEKKTAQFFKMGWSGHLLAAILLVVSFTPKNEAGKVFLFAPFLSKSVTITFVPLVKELADRGHQV